MWRFLFPADYRTFRGKRVLNIGLRTAHLIGTAGVGGGFLYQAPRESWLPYLALTIGSGLALALLELLSNAIWLIQLRGLAIVVKLGLLACLPHVEGYQAHALVLSVILSGIFSHAPGRIRYFSILHGREVHTLTEPEPETEEPPPPSVVSRK